MKKSTSAVIAVSSLLSLPAIVMSGVAFGGEPQAKRVVLQARGAAMNVGTQHIVSYFTADNGVCNVTMLIGNAANEDGEGASVGTRVSFAVPGGKSARADTAAGKSLEISCAAAASTMSIRPVDRLAYAAPAK